MYLYRPNSRQHGRYSQWLVWIIFCAVISSRVYAGDTPVAERETSKQEYWSIQFENDFFARSGDRYYTHGTQVSRTIMGQPPQWLKDVASSFPAFASDGTIQGVNYTIGQTIFTPDNTEATQVVVNDRPYAGYLYFSTALLSRVSNKNNINTANLLELTLGIVGPSSYAKEVQTDFHDLMGIESPKGWDNQLSDEPGFGISYTRFWRHITPLNSDIEYGMTPHMNMVIGNVYTYAASGVMFRLGTHLNNDLAPPNIRPGFPGLSLFRVSQQNNWYLFAGVEVRAVARNIFLDGNSFNNSYSVDKKPLVGDFQFGYVFQSGGLRLSFSNMIRTKEFYGQKDDMRFGAINISFLL